MLSDGIGTKIFWWQATRRAQFGSEQKGTQNTVANFWKAGTSMLLLLAIVLVILWAGGFFVMHISSLFIHLLIVFAVISLVMHLLGGNRA